MVRKRSANSRGFVEKLQRNMLDLDNTEKQFIVRGKIFLTDLESNNQRPGSTDLITTYPQFIYQQVLNYIQKTAHFLTR